jgi:hypothetical protein
LKRVSTEGLLQHTYRSYLSDTFLLKTVEERKDGLSDEEIAWTAGAMIEGGR